MLDYLKEIREQHQTLTKPAAAFLLPGSLLVGVSKLTEESWYNDYAIFAALVLLTFGVLIVLVHLFLPFFENRPAKGAFDGAVAGFFGGLVGGYLGYGSHELDFHVCFNPDPFLDSSLLRISYCVAFAVPIGAMLGAIADVFLESGKLEFRKLFSRRFSIGLALVIMTTVVVSILLPAMDYGISGSDLLILVSCYTVFLFGIVTFGDAKGHRFFVLSLLTVLSTAALTALAMDRVRFVDGFSFFGEIEDIDNCKTSLLDFQFASDFDIVGSISENISAEDSIALLEASITLWLIFGAQIWVIVTCFLCRIVRNSMR